MKLWHRACLAAAALLAFSLEALAQEPKPGNLSYKNAALGFEFRYPDSWEQIGAQPGDENLLVKYDPPSSKYIEVDKDSLLFLHAWVVKFDRRKKEDEGDDKGKLKLETRHKDLATWISKGEAGPGFKLDGKPKESKINKLKATEYAYVSTKAAQSRTGKSSGFEVRLYAMVYELEPDLEVALVVIGPGEKKWSKFERGAEAMARTMRKLEVDAPVASAGAEDTSLRGQKKKKLLERLANTPEWKLYETPNYFIVSNNEDKAFIDELMGRLEAIRGVYERDYPIEKAKEYRELAKQQQTQDAGAKKEPENGEGKLAELITGGADPQELSKCSVVRVCKNSEQYHSYGGPAGSAGYWAWVQEELVIYDARSEGGKGDTWATLNHEAFHQFIFYFYGNISPQSWYNEGTGDFYSGYQYKNRQFKLEKFQWRVGLVKSNLQADKFVPLKEFVRYTQQQYYSTSSYGTTIGDHYAQGWSFIYFLRTGKKNNAKGWDPKWDGILDQYLKTLAMTGKTEIAVDEAFAGVDMDALEAAWIEYTK